MNLSNIFTIRENNLKKMNIILILTLSFLFIVSRVLFLDRDLPPWQLTEYQPIDEFYYSITGFNLYHYGQVAPRIVSYVPTDGTIENLLGNILTFITLKIFGNTYFGLRMPSVIASFLTFLMLYFIFRRRLDNDDKKFKVIIFWMIYLVFDFSFLIAGRVFEPTIFRTLALILVIYFGALCWSPNKPLTEKHSFWFGILSMLSILFVYSMNIFIFFALLFTIIMSSVKEDWKCILKRIIFYLFGASLVLFIFFLYRMLFTNTIQIEYSVFFPSVYFRLRKFFRIFLTNIFRLNPAFLFVCLLHLPVFIYKTYKSRDVFSILILGLLGSLSCQSFFYNAYYYRKLVIFLPLAIVMIVEATDYIDIFIERTSGFFKSVILAFSLLITLFCIYYQYRFLPGIIGHKIYHLNIAVFIVLACYIICRYFLNIISPSKIAILVFCLLFIPNIFLSDKYIYRNLSYNYRNSMIAVAQKINGKIIAGGWSFSMRLYNTSVPIINVYSYMYNSKTDKFYKKILNRLIKDKIVSCTFGYRSDKQFYEKYDLIPTIEFDISSSVFDQYDSELNYIVLYEK